MSDETHLHRQSEIVSVCDEYESLIRQHKAPRIDEFVLRVDESVRPALVYKLIDIEVAIRSSRGESVSKEELLEQYSHFLASSSSEPWLEETVDNREMPTPMGYSVGGPTKQFAGQQYATFEPPVIEGVTIVRVPGRGGMGVVYEAIQEYLNRRVALKTILAKHFTTAAGIRALKLNRRTRKRPQGVVGDRDSRRRTSRCSHRSCRILSRLRPRRRTIFPRRSGFERRCIAVAPHCRLHAVPRCRFLNERWSAGATYCVNVSGRGGKSENFPRFHSKRNPLGQNGFTCPGLIHSESSA